MKELQKQENLDLLLEEMDSIVFKGALDNLETYDIEPIETEISEVSKNIRLNKISKIVYDKNEDNLDKFNSVFSALHSNKSDLVVILKGEKKHTDIYIGTKNTVSGNTKAYSSSETLRAAISGNFPGINLDNQLYSEDVEELLYSINSNSQKYISSISGVPSLKNDKGDDFIQGLEKIIDGMRGKEYFSVILATPVDRGILTDMELSYQSLYSALSPFESKQLTFSESDSSSVGESLSKGLSKSVAKSIGETKTITDSISQGSSITNSTSETKTKSYSRTFGANAIIVSTSSSFSLSKSKTLGKSETESETLTKSHSKASSVTDTDTLTNSNTKTASNTKTSSTTKTIQISEKNRSVSFLLEVLDEQLSRIRECKNYGMWNWSSYFIGANSIDVKLGTDLYSGILRGETSGIEKNSITLWDRNVRGNFKKLQNYISQLEHPVYKTPNKYEIEQILGTSLISTKEVAVAMSLPQKSLPGIPVLESVEFGRSVTQLSTDLNKKEKIKIGSIFNLGSIDNTLDVELDIDSFTSHTFVTGSTGAGKSNSIYLMLNKLRKEHDVPFLVIEPAKGEYKNVFGGDKRVNVFGTNPQVSEILRINPFSFTQSIHVTEHIDRLIEILNAVWPMYAAMPAILKDAVEQTYQSLGWDLVTSKCKYGDNIFPDFTDLMNILPKVIENSEYSAEIKSNYAGALITRVKSMTNGFYKLIFQKDEIEPSEIFDKSTIIDLSRVGSSETKSMLMGIVFLKLQEYRMSSGIKSNSTLKHITVLEEAHNLLKKTSSSQSQEGENLQGKSVEMISNAIAEMRTYGEGFIISDQAPGLLDQSVIRNTNTKIILRLPDFDDRNLVGKAANLNDEQICELARLRTGCAAVYQNNWQEAVLCQYDYYNNELFKGFNYTELHTLSDLRASVKKDLLQKLVRLHQEGIETINVNNIEQCNSYNMYYPELMSLIGKDGISTISALIQVFDLYSFIDRIPSSENIKVWGKKFYDELVKEFDQLDCNGDFLNQLFIVLIETIRLIKPENDLIITRYLDSLKQFSEGIK